MPGSERDSAVPPATPPEGQPPAAKLPESAGPVDPADRNGTGRYQRAAGPPYRLPAPCLPLAISYDPADEAVALTHARMLTDPGVQPKRGAAVVCHVVAWWCGPWGMGGCPQGWRRVVPCAALLDCEGTLYRFFGWDAVNTLARAVCGTDAGRLEGGFDAHARCAVDPSGDHWWWVIDRLAPDGEIPSERVANVAESPQGGAARPGAEAGARRAPPAPQG